MSRPLHAALLSSMLLCLSPALADGGGGGGGAEAEAGAAGATVARAVEAIKAERFAEAIRLLAPHVRLERDDADAHNWLAYAYRKSGQLERAFVHYKRALQIMPGHLGAHEYIGEAYLMAGQPERAEYHLRELARLCAAQCEQYEDLKSAIAAHKAGATTTASKP